MTKRNGMDRREFVTTTAGAAVAAALGPTIHIRRPQKTLKILQWSHVVGGDEVAPLEDFEGFLGASDVYRGPQGCGHRRPCGRRDELTPIHPVPLRHGPTLRWLKERVSGVG